MPELQTKGCRVRFALHPVAMLVGLLLQGSLAHAQDGQTTEPPLVLRPSPQLQETFPDDVRKGMPTFMSGDRTEGQTDRSTVLEGNAELRRGDTVIRADRLEYLQADDLAKATGNVYVNQAGNIYEGTELQLRVEAFEGFFKNPRYQFLRTEGHGDASRIDFIDEQRSIIHDATYTTCRRVAGPDWLPDWLLRATVLHIDQEEDVGLAEGGVLTFKQVPILAVPAISFPLSDKRKSGLLPPTVGLDNVNGVEITQPYYWNIAPNRDATIYPTVMSKRGVELGGQFRYMENNYQGQTRLDYMPNDKLRDRDRWGFYALHNGTVDTGIAAIGNVGLSLNLNRVSDDNYWRDFSRAMPGLTQRLLPNDVNVGWGKGNFSAGLRTLKWQTLQDVTTPITPPYDRLPQVFGKYSRFDVNGLDFSVEADYTKFRADRALTAQPNAERSYTMAQVSHPWAAPGWFITPRLQMHATNYQFDAALANGQRTASRVLPTASLDTGLVFERSASFFGRSFTQTLEPRAFYVYTPYRDQSLLPNYDSAANDFNFATVFTENAFGGQDRISDSNLLTLGTTTRLLDPDTGAEAARFGIAQRLRFSDQRVTMPGQTPVSERLSDVLLGATINWTPQWSFDSTVQFNPDTQRSIRSVIGGRYNPGNYRLINAAYRTQRGVSEQIDIGWQWPLNDLWGDRGEDKGAGRGLGPGRWYSVGRLNYSMQDRKLVDTVVGLEYEADCWIGRIVMERLQSSSTTSNKRILFQLEFVGFTRLGSSPLQTLKQNIPRYQYLREQTTVPSRFSNYD